MFTTEFLAQLKSQSAVINEQSVLHFGAAEEELRSISTGAAVCPILNWIRIRVTGNDRAKFLHNFCTNDINGLAVGKCCEAIFTDVKAKTLAFGFVLAGETHHEIWLNAEAADGLLQHLNRYIITEDVTIEAVKNEFTAFAVIGQTAIAVASAAVELNIADINTCSVSDAAVFLCCEWNQQPIVIICVPAESAADCWNRLNADGAVRSGEWLFDHQRICEGIPIFEQDITSDHLAPEAGRNSQAISYTKGCYLGQEPIARIDAMGHVNKQIFKCVATPVEATTINTTPVALTSVSKIETKSTVALTMLSVKVVESGEAIVAKDGDGKTYHLQLNMAD